MSSESRRKPEVSDGSHPLEDPEHEAWDFVEEHLDAFEEIAEEDGPFSEYAENLLANYRRVEDAR